MLNASQPSPALSSPSVLRYTTATNVEAITNASGPLNHLQLKTSQILADVLTNNAFKFTISFFTAADAGSKDTDGFYQPTDYAFRTLTVENPDTTSSYNRLRITASDGATTVTDYIYSTNSGRWEMDTGNGLRKESRISVWDAGQTNRTETVTVTNSADQLVYREINSWRLFPWGQELLTNVVDPGGAKLTNIWTFYDNATSDGGNYRQLKLQVNANGHWTSYQYDENGRETNRVSQFLNSAVGSAPDSNRVTITVYSTNAPQITTIGKLLGTEISRLYQIVSSGEVDNIQCQTAAAALNAANNLTNITRKYTNGSFAGQIKSSRNADGTVQAYLYSTNATQKTTALLSGVPDPTSETNILSGTIATTVTMLGGQTLTNTIKSRQPGASDVLIAQDIYTYLDSRNRSFR